MTAPQSSEGCPRSACKRSGPPTTGREARGCWRACVVAAIGILATLPVAAGVAPAPAPARASKSKPIVVEPAPPRSLTAEHAACFLFPDESDVRLCLMTFDLLVEIGAR